MNVTGDLNTGVLIRSAHLMGVKKVLIFGRNRFDDRSTVGSTKYTEVVTYGGLREDLTIDPEVFCMAMDDNYLTPVFVETGEFCVTQVDFRSVRQSVARPLCFVLGNEGRGIDAGILATRNHFDGAFNVSIPMAGVMRSYNVANAGAMIMFEYCRQMYGS
jgi:tRNA G18 (ribose-2'-O)-methylase SpoU